MDTSYQTSGNSEKLSQEHRRHLAKSGIAPDVIAERGTFSARKGKDVPQEHGKLPEKPGIVFPVHTLDGGLFYRLRPNSPGRGPKYRQPKGHPNRLDVHPRQHERIKAPGGMRFVTEGEKKVDAGVSRGLLMVGMSGVWNGQKDKELIPDWGHLPLEGERYSITFDSDIESNPHVQMAADRMARLLRERGAEVYITLLPPAGAGGKQGLDDFFANGGTVKQLQLLTRPYDESVVERVRLTRNEKLRAAVEDLFRRWWATEWKGQGGHTDRDLALRLIEAARKHGRVVKDGVRVTKAWGTLALEAKISSTRTVGKAISRLEDAGFCYRDNEGRQADKTGAFVLRASVKHHGERGAQKGTLGPAEEEGASGTLHLRAPRLMWSRPKFTPKKRGFAKRSRRVRESKPPEPRDPITRLGKVRGAVLDALEAAGGRLPLAALCEVLHRKRPRDIRRRILPILEEAGVLGVEDDVVILAEDWLERLDEVRELGGEIEASEVARERYRLRSDAYHGRQKHPSGPSEAGLAAVRRSHKMRAENMAAHEAHEAEARAKARAAQYEAMVFAKRFVHDRMRVLGRVRLEILEGILFDAGGVARFAGPAAKSLGCTIKRLPEYGDEEFVYAPAEWGVA